MRNRPNIFSIEIPIKDKFYQGQDLKEKIHSPEFRVTWFIPSKAKVEWSKSPSGSVEEIEAKSSIQPFARSPDLFSKWTEPRYHIHQRDTAISLGCTPPLDRSIRAWKDPIGPLLLRDILSRPPHPIDQIVNSFRPLVSLGWGRVLPSTEYKKPYSSLTSWHPGEESHYLCHIL